MYVQLKLPEISFAVFALKENGWEEHEERSQTRGKHTEVKIN